MKWGCGQGQEKGELLFMVIDFHTHTFPEKIAAATIRKLEGLSGLTAATDGTLPGLRKSMEEAGVAVSVVLPVITRPEQFSSINTYARKITPEHFTGKGEEIVSFGAVHPYSRDRKAELKEVKGLGLKGIKIHPDYLRIMIDDPQMMRLIDEACQLDLIISIHAGIDIGLPDKVHCPPEKSARVLKEIRPQNCVLAHTGGFRQWDAVEELLAGTDVWLDISMSNGFMDDGQMKRIIKAHGADRMLFGTDSPWGGQAADIAWVKGLGLKPEEEEKLLWKNAAGLLKLEF